MRKIRSIAINWLKNIGLTMLMLTAGLSAMACEACKKQQPKLLRGITHGAGPDSGWDYVIVVVMIIVTLYVLYATVKCIFRPSENNNEHIKRLILND
jgi:hypothetical protein